MWLRTRRPQRSPKRRNANESLGRHALTHSTHWHSLALHSLALAGRPPYISANFKTLLDEVMHAPPPRLPKFSSAFNDLLARCLAKDAAARISLSEVLAHPFWDVKFPPLSLPDQPPAASSGHAVDVLRLSRAMVRPPSLPPLPKP